MKITAIILLFAALTLTVEGQRRWPWERPPRPPPFRPIQTPLPPPPDLNTAAPAVDGSGALIGCRCQTTPEFNPVCGSDGLTYGSPQKLNCARSCGQEVTLMFYGNCAAG